MIFKILYQEEPNEAPVRERTKSIFIEAESIKEVRQKLNERNYNIEYIQPLDELHLEYEKKSADFVLEKF